MKRILYIRSGPYQVNLDAYNLQELGLARAFFDFGYECDVMYYHKKDNFDQEIEKNGVKIKILWRHGIKLLRSGIYPQILNKNFLKQYDIVICSEYSQIMSILLAKRHNNVYIYNGPYYNLFKVSFLEKIYDYLFINKINKYVKKVFCKTKKAEDYLKKKGVTNTKVVGVGLDTEKFNEEIEIEYETQQLLNSMNDSINLLYVGQIIKRKNVDLIIKSFNEMKKELKYNNVKLIIIGKGNKKYTQYCKSLINNNSKDSIIWIDYLKNSQLKFIYKKANIFLLPSYQEIFGMVLLEAMYFSDIVISSNSAGADTLIDDGIDGYIIKEFNENIWKDKIKYLLDNPKKIEVISKNSNKKIMEGFLWDKIVEKMIKEISSE